MGLPNFTRVLQLVCETFAYISVIFRNFTKVMGGEEWLSLPMEKVVEIISADELEVEREEHVFDATTAWLHHSYPTRAPVFHKVCEDAICLVEVYCLFALEE